jgi:hypothetical protein
MAWILNMHLDPEYASGLQMLSFNGGEIPVLDLKNNSELRSLSFVSTYVGEITLPQQHAITSLSIEPITDWTQWPSATQVDYMIDNIHTNAVAGNYRSGYIGLGASPVSAQSAELLDELRIDYGWGVDYY